MPILHFGVIDLSYGDTASGNAPKKGAATTGDVAEILEEKYGLMQAFFNAHEQDIADALTDAVTDVLESMLMGAPPSQDAFGPGESQVQEMFKQFLSSQEAEGVGIPNTPTGAAMKGVNHRLKHPYAKANPRRPSFIDTGMFSSSFKAWVD